MHFIAVIENDSQVYTSRSDGQDVASKTKSNTLYNNIDANITQEKPVQEKLLNYERENRALVKCSKRTPQRTRTKQTKRRRKLLTTDKGIYIYI